MNNIFDNSAAQSKQSSNGSVFPQTSQHSGNNISQTGGCAGANTGSAANSATNSENANSNTGLVNDENNGVSNVLQANETLSAFAEKLSQNVGFFTVCEFVIGEQLVAKQGILSEAGNNYILLYDDVFGIYTLCDLASLRFATLYNSKVTPRNFRNVRR